jgi:hypothetical protein
MLKSKTTEDPVKQLEQARAQRKQVHSSMSDLTSAAERSVVKRHTVKAELDRAEGDFLIGTIDEATLNDVRKRFEQSLRDEQMAHARVRKAEADDENLRAVIARLGPVANAARVNAIQEQVRDVLRETLPLFDALQAKMERLHEIHLAAETEFPHYHEGLSAGEPRPYPVAAGLLNFSWPELRDNPHAMNGGRLGTWRKAVKLFLTGEEEQVPALPPARTMADLLGAPVKRVRSAGLWQPEDTER